MVVTDLLLESFDDLFDVTYTARMEAELDDIEDGKQDWIIYHANAKSQQGCGQFRSPRIQPFTWNSDGTPNFGEPVSTDTAIQKPSGQ